MLIMLKCKILNCHLPIQQFTKGKNPSLHQNADTKTSMKQNTGVSCILRNLFQLLVTHIWLLVEGF